MTITASCICKKVQFSSASAPILQFICHCQDCRDATGDDYSTTAFFKKDAVKITGEVTTKTYISAKGNRTTRESCAACGTPIIDKSDGFPSLLGVFANRIEAQFKAAPTCHIWTRSRLPHVSVGIGLPEHSEGLS